MPNPNASKASKPTKSLVPVIRLDDPRSRPNDYDGGGDGNDDDDCDDHIDHDDDDDDDEEPHQSLASSSCSSTDSRSNCWA